jgi:hypothetical protein
MTINRPLQGGYMEFVCSLTAFRSICGQKARRPQTLAITAEHRQLLEGKPNHADP